MKQKLKKVMSIVLAMTLLATSVLPSMHVRAAGDTANELTPEEQHDVYYDFSTQDLNGITDYTATKYDKGTYQPVAGTYTLTEQWWSNVTKPSGVSVTAGRENDGIKIREDNKAIYRLDLAKADTSFEVTSDIYHKDNYGIVFGKSGVAPYRKSTEVASVRFAPVSTTNSGLLLEGMTVNSFKGCTKNSVDLSATANANSAIECYRMGISAINYTNSDKSNINKLYRLKIRVVDKAVTIGLDYNYDGIYDTVINATLNDDYVMESIGLCAQEYKSGGGFKNVHITYGAGSEPDDDTPTLPEIDPVQAQAGEQFSQVFEGLTADEVEGLKDDFSAFYFVSGATAGQIGWPADYWTTGANGYAAQYQNTYLKATENTSNANTLLTYHHKIFKNVEVAAEYATTHSQYGIMIAPEGETATASNGISAYVQGNGTIVVKGAIDAASATATGGYAQVNSSNVLCGFPLTDKGYVVCNSDAGAADSNKTTYTLRIKIVGNELQASLDEFSDYVLKVKLTDAYQGGLVSLYTNANSQGGFKSFEAVELADLGTTAETGVYYQSFNTISALSELEDDFVAYKLDAVGNEAVEVPINNVYKLSSGRLKSALTQVGTDKTGFGFITLKDKQYEDFELTLQYQQSNNRYGVMIGTKELGEFAFEENGNNLKGTNGAFVYTEMQGFRNIRGNLDMNSYTNSHSAICRVTEDTANYLDSFVAFKGDATTSDVLATLKKQHIHTMVIRVVDGCMTVIVDGDEASRVTVRLADYDGGYISLVTNSDATYGAFLSLTVKELDGNAQLGTELPPDINLEQAVEGDAFSQELAGLSAEEIQELKDDFSTYYFIDGEEEPQRGWPSNYWTTNAAGNGYTTEYQNNYFKAINNASDKNNTLLTYHHKNFKNVEVAAEYATSHSSYGIMIAPEGELANASNGIQVYVQGDGTFVIKGAIDAASATATGGQAKVNRSQVLCGYPLTEQGYVVCKGDAGSAEANKTTYTLRVRVSGNELQVSLDEFSDYVITVALTDAYKGGVVSLFTNAHGQGGFKSFEAVELAEPESISVTGAYSQSFNTISSLDEIKDDFVAYKVDSVENEAVKVSLEDIFKLSSGKLKSALKTAGTEKTGLGFITLKDKKYDNFELTLKYEQSNNRYGVMIGTKELGEFAYEQNGNNLKGTNGALVYTEMQGYRNIRGNLYASSYTNASTAVCRIIEDAENYLDSFVAFKGDETTSDVLATLKKQHIHTMVIRVVDGYMTVVIDGDEASRVTVRLVDYDGGYISLVTNADAIYGSFLSLSIRELGDDAELGTTLPDTSNGFQTMKQLEDMFEAYYLADIKTSNKMEKVVLDEHWYLNDGGFVTRVKGHSGSTTIEEDLEVLTYKEKKFKDFELSFNYQQTYDRLGVIIGTDRGEFPLFYNTDEKLEVDKGVIYYTEAEGYTNARGDLHNYTTKSSLSYRITNLAPEGFTTLNAAGNLSAMDNVTAKKVHSVKIVVKDSCMYVFLDGSDQASLYVKLGDDYAGGYVSLFSTAGSKYGFSNFTISDKITTKLPKAGGVTVSGDTMEANFDVAEFDDKLFTSYYLEAVKNNADGTMTKTDFDDQWTVANGVLKRTSKIENGSDKEKVSALTYNKEMKDFIVSYDYQQDSNRLMLMFGTEQGKYALSQKETGSEQENGGVIIYPEFNLGTGGGMLAFGNVTPLTSSGRPANYTILKGLDYYVKTDKGSSAYLGKWHHMTIAVINQHCYVYIDDYGLVMDYELTDDYKGGYVSIAATGCNYGFKNLKITDLSAVSDKTVVKAENPRDITVATGTEASALKLPETVKVTLKNGQTVDASIDWINFNYDGSTAGTYKYTAIVKESDAIQNPAQVGVKINVRVVDEIVNYPSNVKFWSFDTDDDLRDFQAYYLENKEVGYLKAGTPQWYASTDGVLNRDKFRSENGDASNKLSILTYAAETYKNFELEVDYVWNPTRMMVLLGSTTPGEYMDLNEMRSESNPTAVFVEMEGVTNIIGNVKNTTYGGREGTSVTDTTFSKARDDGDRVPNYFNKEKINSNYGKMHHMKIRVVGDQISVWVDDYKEPYVATLTNYVGGYISLISTVKGGTFDNLKITRLSDSLEETVQEIQAVANGYLDLKLDSTASTDLVKPERTEPDKFDSLVEEVATRTISAKLVEGGVIASSVLIGLVMILFAIRKKKKQEAL